MTHTISAMLPDDVDAGDTLYIVDKQLGVVYTNDGWKRFALNNHGGKLLDPGWNKNLLENMRGKEKARWRHIYRLLLASRIPRYKENFVCSSPFEKRIYQLRITPQKDNRGKVAWLVHHTSEIDAGQAALARISKRFRRIDSPRRVIQEYRQRIINRRIRIPGFQTARHFKPLEDIGGDLLWHRLFPARVAHLMHADVMGHGAAAGRYATQIAMVLDEITDVDKQPRSLAAILNRAMSELADDDVIFATGLSFRFAPREQRLTCANFGHHSPIFSRTGQIAIDRGPPVGLADEVQQWPESPIDMAKHGNRFLVFSDGITDQFNLAGEMFGTDRLVRAFRRYIDRPLDEMLGEIVRELNGFRNAALVKDDQTLLALEFIGEPEGLPAVSNAKLA